jgi:hypothetical protein
MDDFSGIKKEALEAVAKQYLGTEKAMTFGLMPAVKQGT